MAQQALYRKYRSKTLDDVVGQEHITKTLEYALKNDKVRHAYLFTGPHGVGKTSVARILAHEINSLDYDGTSHLDIIEIDAASNRRIDEVRDLREKARIAPVSAKFKVYIIDEVHMLTNEAFNALLKTLEEPPEHVIFILATTDAQKLPDTIISRTQRFSFKTIDQTSATSHMKKIAKQEKIDITDSALELLYRNSKGSFRDAISLLDQVSTTSGSKIDETAVEKLLGIASEEAMSSIIESLTSSDLKTLADQLSDLSSQGVAATTLAEQIASKLSELVQSGDGSSFEVSLMNDLLTVADSSQPQRRLEVVLFERVVDEPTTVVQTPKPAKEPRPAKIEEEPTPKQPEKPAEAIAQEPAAETPTPVATKPAKETKPENKQPSGSDDLWAKMLDEVKQVNNALHAVIRMSKPTLNGNTLNLAFKFPFHQKRADQAANKKSLGDIASKVYGAEVELTTTQDSSVVIDTIQTEDETLARSVSPNESASSVLDIMGGGEVVAYDE